MHFSAIIKSIYLKCKLKQERLPSFKMKIAFLRDSVLGSDF